MNPTVHRVGAATVLLISFGGFLKTVAPTVSFWDCGEFIACSYILGVPHPPGAPLYLLLGRLFTFLPFGEDPAFPMNLMSVITSALAAMFVYLITVRLILLTREGDAEGEGLWRDLPVVVGGMTAALMLAFSNTFWFNAVETEVYGFSIMLMTMAVWLGMRWMVRPGQPGSRRLLFFVAYLMGLAGGIHLLCLLTVPTLLILIWFEDRDLLKDPKIWAIAPMLVVLGYSTYAALYVRSGLNPMIDENNPENWTNLMGFLKREQYGAESMVLGIFNRKAPFWDYQLGSMYLKYFFDQFPVPGFRFVSEAFRKATGPEVLPVRISVLPYLLGFGGMAIHLLRDSRRFLALFALFLLTGVGLVVYLNMPDPQPRERDYVFVGSFAVFAIWIGMAGETTVRWLRQRLPAAQGAAQAGRLSALLVLASAALLLMPAGMAGGLYKTHDRTGNHIAYDYAYNILASCEPEGILFTNGDNDTFPLWFLQEVMGLRKDVRVVNLSLLNTGWYIKQLRDLHPGVLIQYTDAYIDGVLTRHTRAALMRAGRFWPRDREVTAAGMTWTVPAFPWRVLRIQDVMVLKIIDWNAWGRPIYFATTVPDENLLGLEGHLEMEGMVFRLVREKARPIHPERARRNLFEVYRYRGVTDPAVHRGETALNLMVNYQAAFLHLAEARRLEGQVEEAHRVLKWCEDFAVAPESWTGYLLLAGGMHQLGRADEFRRLLDRALATEAADETAKQGAVAEMLMGFKRFEEAVALYTDMVDRGMNVPLALFNRAVARQRLGQLEGALEDLQMLARLTPHDGDVARAIRMIRGELEQKRQQDVGGEQE